MTITAVAEGLSEPWSLGFLPDGGFLVTERGGRLLRYPAAGGGPVEVSGLPAVFATGQGGLLDVLVPRDHAQTGEIFLSFAAASAGGGGTALLRARLDGSALSDPVVIWTMSDPTGSPVHFGGRIVEAMDGTLFLTTGDRGEGMPAQDPGRHRGKIIRVARDGSIPADNPAIPGAPPEVWSLGHRNPQGATLDGEGRLWASEHGAQGGDEVNLVQPGRNYGWPVITYGRDYDGSRIGEGTAKTGMEQPAHYWDPSIAPSGHMIYSGKLWPGWAGDHFIGSLKFDMISRLDPDRWGEGGWSEERIAAPQTGRVRDIREAPDGSIWFLSVNDGAVYRMAPSGQP
ncbi:MAG: hypothetical protein RLZZ528_1737 [Pseudomonadota bacterium]